MFRAFMERINRGIAFEHQAHTGHRNASHAVRLFFYHPDCTVGFRFSRNRSRSLERESRA